MLTAIVDGVSGQDGSYMADILLEKGYRVIGLVRRSSTKNDERFALLHSNKRFSVEYFSLFDPTSFTRLILKYKPDEYYHLAAQSHVKVSFETPIETMSSILLGTAYILEAIRHLKPSCRFYQASSSEMYGRNTDVPLSETSIMLPASPYACAKLGAHHLVQNYRESYGLFACSGILFNHESPRRGETFVTRKITKGVAEIKMGVKNKLILGNLDAKRDWGYAREYMEGAWLMLQQDRADDYVLATGETHTVLEFLEEVFNLAELSYKEYVEIDKNLFRPQEVPVLLGDASKAERILGWKPKLKFKELASLMYKNDLADLTAFT
jgi:GDPmannose 4,6-dehydratase